MLYKEYPCLLSLFLSFMLLQLKESTPTRMGALEIGSLGG